MVSSSSRSLIPDGRATWHDAVIERGLVALLVFAPLAFAGVTVWAASVVQIAAFFIFGVWLARNASREAVVLRPRGMIIPLGLFALLAGLQLVPLPAVVLSSLSPATAALYGTPGAGESGRWHPISAYPQATLQELLNLLAYLAMFIVVAQHFRERRQIMMIVRTVVVMGCLLVVIAVLQKAAWNGRLYWFYPIDPALAERADTIWGPYINRNHFAGYLEMAAPLAMGMALYAARRPKGEEEKSLGVRMAAFASDRRLALIALSVLAVVVLSGALFATLSRGAILGYAVSAAAFVLLARSRHSLRGRVAVLFLAGMIVAVVGLFAAWGRIEDRFTDIATEDRVQRVRVWSDLKDMARAFPLVGTGLGTFDRVYPRYQTRYSTLFFEHAENDYLELLTDTGLAGCATMLWSGSVFFVVAVRGWRTRKNPLSTCIGLAGIASCTAIAVHSLTDFNLRVPANALLFAVIAGLTMASILRPHSGGQGRVRAGWAAKARSAAGR